MPFIPCPKALGTVVIDQMLLTKKRDASPELPTWGSIGYGDRHQPSDFVAVCRIL
jgi:hypothetical protein